MVQSADPLQSLDDLLSCQVLTDTVDQLCLKYRKRPSSLSKRLEH